MKEFTAHVSAKHRLAMCELCVENRKVFVQELEMFTKAELKQHEVDGVSRAIHSRKCLGPR